MLLTERCKFVSRTAEAASSTLQAACSAEVQSWQTHRSVQLGLRIPGLALLFACTSVCALSQNIFGGCILCVYLH
jgi:hypothetical protein